MHIIGPSFELSIFNRVLPQNKRINETGERLERPEKKKQAITDDLLQQVFVDGHRSSSKDCALVGVTSLPAGHPFGRQ